MSSLSFRGDLPQGRGSSLSSPETFGPWNTADKTEGTRTPALQSHSKDWMIHAQSTVWNVEGVRKAHRQNSGAINVFFIIHEVKTSLRFCCVFSEEKKKKKPKQTISNMVQISPKLYALPRSEHPCAFSAVVAHSSTWSLFHPTPQLAFPSVWLFLQNENELKAVLPQPPAPP